MRPRTQSVCTEDRVNPGWLPRAVMMFLAPLLGIWLFNAPVAAAETVDLRVLVDVSGSMKKNDPANLRIAASKLLVDLLPEGASAAIWSFAGDATPLVPAATVDEAWREQARNAVPNIHSRGQFTDMRTVLEAATADWRDSGSRAVDAPGRALILLTDGVVDVDGGATASAVSRGFILGDLASELKALGVTVHTVALSRSADRELLAALADATDGRYELAEDAAALNRVFLRMFEQSVDRDAVPLSGNRFTIDSSISEFTLVAFHGESPKPIYLATPLGTQLDATTRDPDVRWRRDQGYDLITIAQPPPGEWVLEGAEDPDNRVMIVTNLGLAVDPLPAYILSDESLNTRFRLTEGDVPLTRADFLDLVEAVVALNDGAPVTADRSDTGDFSANLPAYGGRGEIEIRFTVRGETFQRVAQRRVTVIDNPLRLSAQLDTVEGEPGITDPSAVSDARQPRLHLEFDEAVLEPGSIRLVVVQQTPTNGQLMSLIEGPEIPSLDAWRQPGEYALDALATAVTRRGRLVQSRATALTLQIPDLAAEAAAAELSAASERTAQFPWPLLGAILIVGNIGLGVGVFFALRAIRRQSSTDSENSENNTRPDAGE